MSLKIEINLPDDSVSRYALDDHMNALGFERREVVQYGTGLATPAPLTAKEVEGAVAEARDAEASAGENITTTETRTKRGGRKAKEDAKPQISTNPENRQPPEDDEATQAQDEADEAAEVAKEPDADVTAEDIRAVMGEYVNKFSMEAIQADGANLFLDTLGKPPAGEKVWKLSLLGDVPQDKMRTLLKAWRACVDGGKRYGA